MKIGIFGGTFNPVHNGHIRLADEFKNRLGLDKIIVVPDKRPVHKTWEDLIIDDMRYDMCALAFDRPGYEVSRMEMDRESDSYTVLTVRELRKQYKDDELYLIIGSDMFLIFHKWYKYREIMENCTLCVASRDDADSIFELRSYAFSFLKVYIKELEGKGIIISPVQPYKLSSSEIRQKIKNGADVSEFVPEKVYEYIKKRGLYGYPKE